MSSSVLASIRCPLFYLALWAYLTSVCYSLPAKTTPANLLLRRAAPSPLDLSWITNWASVGDSYSAGIGAGNRYGGWGDYFCSRYDESFPAIINADQRLGVASGRTFTYWPCSGAVTDDVLSQVNSLIDGSQDFITITSGGNDANLAGILNECVFQWYSGADPVTSKCPNELSKAQDVIASSDFHSKLDKLLSTAKTKLKPGGQIYHVGYAKFFGADSNQCDSVTWAFWFETGKREYLTQDKRTQMNTIVQNMNNVLSAAVSRAGSDVTFIEYDTYYTQSLGRFCEDNYPETNPNRYGLLFYEWDTDDNAPETDGATAQVSGPPLAITPGLVMNGTFEASINNYIRQTIAQNSTWGQNWTTVQGTPPTIDSLNATKQQIVKGSSSNLVPDGYGRVFHPRPNGHQLIANLIFYEIEANYAKKLNQNWPAEEITSGTCPAPQAVSTGTSTTPTMTMPTPPPAAKDLCGDWYKVLFDHFEIYGEHFNITKFGTDGSGLKKQIKGCGDLTEWSYKTLTDDPSGYQWKATGNLPIGTKACVGRAIISAGGTSKSGCTGAG